MSIQLYWLSKEIFPKFLKYRELNFLSGRYEFLEMITHQGYFLRDNPETELFEWKDLYFKINSWVTLTNVMSMINFT